MLEVFQTQTAIILRRFAFAFHATQSHAYPAVEGAVHVAAR